MATLETTSTLAPIREKVEAGERLDLEDGLALLESDDLLALGELADLARRLRGGTDEVFFVQNLYLNQTNVCRVKCKFCAFAATRKQEQAYTITTEELVEDAVAAARADGVHRDPHGQRREPARRLRVLPRHDRALHEAMPDVHLKCYTASEIHHMTTLSGLTHEQVLRELQAAGLGSLPGGGAEVFAHRVRQLVAPGKEDPGDLVPRARHRAPARHPDALHDALRARRDVRGADRPLAPPARAAGPDGWLPRLHPARVPPREHGLRAPRLAAHDRLRRPQDARGLAAAARQHPERQGLLDHDGDAARGGRAPLRRQRRPGHRRARGDLQGRRGPHRHRAEGRRARPLRARRRAGSRCSATRSTTSCGGGREHPARAYRLRNMAPVFYRLEYDVERSSACRPS